MDTNIEDRASNIGNNDNIQHVQTVPVGVPPGLPKEFWMEYLLKMKESDRQQELELKRIESDRQQELELKRLEANTQIELQKLQNESSSETSSTSSVNGTSNHVKVLRLQSHEDIDIYLRAYELLAESIFLGQRPVSD